nr:putative reverse transcriptase domain-containing protein [Tanacetum cinerariifolium]
MTYGVTYDNKINRANNDRNEPSGLQHDRLEKPREVVEENESLKGWRVCIDYRKLNDVTRKDYCPLPFIDQMSERLSKNEYYYFLDGFLRFFQILIGPEDQEKMTFTCLYGTFAYRRMPFDLCNAPTTFQRCMTTIFQDMVKSL